MSQSIQPKQQQQQSAAIIERDGTNHDVDNDDGDDNVPNQLKHQQTSSTLLNHHHDPPKQQHQQQQNANALNAKLQAKGHEQQIATSNPLTQPSHTMAMHNFGPNSHNQQDQQQQHQLKQASDTTIWQGNQSNNNQGKSLQQTSANNSTNNQPNIANPSPPNSAPSNGRHQLTNRGSPSPSSQIDLQASLASRVDQIIRSSLHDTPHAHAPRTTAPINLGNNNNMPSQSSSSSSASMIFNPVSSLAAISTAHHNHLQAAGAATPVSTSSLTGFTQATALSQLNPFYGTSALSAQANISSSGAIAASDTLSNINTSNSNLSAKTSAQTASHSALAAAAALQSLNQSHLQRSHHQQQQQHHHHLSQQQQQQIASAANATAATAAAANNSRPGSNSLGVPQAAHGNSSYMPKLGITSTTSSDHHNHNHHLALSGQQHPADNLAADLAARFQQQQQAHSSNSSSSSSNKGIPFLSNTMRPPVSWQDQVSQATASGESIGSGAPRWQPPLQLSHGGLVANANLPPFTTTLGSNLPIGLTSSNSNNMIGQEGDNNLSRPQQASRSNSRPPTSSSSAAAAAASLCLDDMSKCTNSQGANFSQFNPSSSMTSKQNNLSWLDGNQFKSPFSISEANNRLQQQSQQIRSDELDRNSERLALFAYNLMSTCIPGTNKPKKVIQLDDELRHSIYSGEFYSRYEHLALGILTNQVIVPGFSIIDYIRRDRFSFHEVERIESVHRKLGVTNFLCLIELAQQRPFSSPMKVPPASSASDSHLGFGPNVSFHQSSPNPNTSQNQAISSRNNQFAFMPPMAGSRPGDLPTGLLGIDKSGRSSQSPSDIQASRSQYLLSNSNTPRLPSAHSSPHHHSSSGIHNHAMSPNISNDIFARSNQNLSTSNTQAQRSSPFQMPMNSGPPNSLPRPPRSHSTIGGLGIGSLDHHHPTSFSPGQPIRQPPAAHQSSSRPNLSALAGSASDIQIQAAPAHSSSSTPVTAHMSSKAPQTPRLHMENNMAAKTPQTIVTSPYSKHRNHAPGSLPPNQIESPPGRFDIDPITGLPVHTMLSLRQQQQDMANRDYPIKRSTTPQSNIGANSFMGQMDPMRSSSNMMESTSRSPMNGQYMPTSFQGHGFGSNIGLKGPPNTQGGGSPHTSSSMPPPLTDFQHKIGSNSMDLHKLNASMNLPPNINVSGANEAQLKQYSAIMAAYQQQQQQLLMSSNQSPNPVMNQSGQSQSSQRASPMFNPTQPIQIGDPTFQDQQANRAQTNPISPKHGPQRSIITGSASSMGPKRAKKVKHSPPASDQPLAGSDLRQPMGDIAQAADMQQQQQQQQQQHCRDKNLPGAPVANETMMSEQTRLSDTQGQSVETNATGEVGAAGQPHQLRAAPEPENKVIVKAADFSASGDVDARNDINFQQCEEPIRADKTPNIGDPIDKGNNNITTNDNNSNDISKDSLPSIKTNTEQSKQQTEHHVAAPATVAVGSDSTATTSASNTTTNSNINNNNNNNYCGTPSKYLFTKKAWLKNYDQEDQSKNNDDTSTNNNMILRNKTEQVKLETVEEPVDIKETTTKSSLPSVKSNGVKSKTVTKSESKKHANEGKSKTKKTLQVPSSRQTKTAGNGSKSADNDSEETNASTSELDDTDETDSLKSANEKKLRRMPKRKVKLNSDKESDQPNSPKSAKTPVSKETNAKKRDKKQRQVSAESGTTVGLKRKYNLDGSVKQSTKKIKEESKTCDKEDSVAKATSDKIGISTKSKKRSGEKFLQTKPCHDFEPKSIRCLECRRFRHSNTKGDKLVQSKRSTRSNWDDFCRFFEFRKLRFNKAGQIVVAGFSDLNDANYDDKRLWLPEGDEIPTNINYEAATYILANVGDQFCKLVLQERSVQENYELLHSGDQDEARIIWKRPVNKLRELCDVCSTTLFNNHYVCERCGFVVCIDCYESRASKSQTSIEEELDSKNKDNSDKTSNASDNGDEQSSNNLVAKKNKRDAHGWIYCAKNEEHSHDKLILTQIIAGDCLEKVWKLLHSARETLDLGRCSCVNSIGPKQGCTKFDPLSSVFGVQDNSKVPHSTLKGLLLANHTDQSTINGVSQTENDSVENERTIDTCKKTSLAATDNKVFDFSNEEDSQDESKQVSAAIDECLASLDSSVQTGDQDSGIKVEKDSKSSSLISSPTNGCENKSFSKLCDGDLLILSDPKHDDNIHLFRGHWRHNKPVIVRGIHELMDTESWSPKFFARKFGEYRSDLVDCRNGEIHKTSMKKYWEGFEPSPGSVKRTKTKEDVIPPHIPAASNEEPSAISTNYYSGSALWRLKDWPPGQDFNEILPDHYMDFMNNLPLDWYTTRTGKLNLACRLPKEMLKPDLGPKMYSAYGTTKFPERGTTNLHLDISDAVNVMVYVNGASAHMSGSTEYKEIYANTIDECVVDEEMKAQIREQKLIPGALWHIFRPSDAPKMREFLNKVSQERKITLDRRNDPIHDQIWYLDQTLLDRLHAEHGVKSYAILQCMGDAILIPAGAPHQVKNLQNCIKVANDFVSPENVHYCLQLTNEFRSLPETHINQEDKLQIKNILYHSVRESLQYIKMLKHSKISGDESKERENWEDIKKRLDKIFLNDDASDNQDDD